MEKTVELKQTQSGGYLQSWRAWLTLLFTMLYFTSYITRINYGAVISEIVKAEGIDKPLASLALTASAITYGVGQLFSGFLGDRINPKKIIVYGLLTTICMNFIMPWIRSPYCMTAVWGINGLAQAFMWPPLVKIMTSLFTNEDYKKSCVYVSWGASFGTMFVYAIAPVCIGVCGWRGIFYLSAAIAIAMTLIWIKKCPNVNVNAQSKKVTGDTKTIGKGFSKEALLVVGIIMLVIVLQGIMRDGVATWMPSYIGETFNLDNKIAILTGVILPVFSILTVKLASLIYRKWVKDELLLVGIMFGLSVAAAFLLYFTDNVSPLLSVFLAAVLSGGMHGANYVLTCMIPPYFGKYGNISFMSGLLNFCTYIGSAISGVGLAAFSQGYGWNSTLLLWGLISLGGLILCLTFKKMWNKVKN